MVDSNPRNWLSSSKSYCRDEHIFESEAKAVIWSGDELESTCNLFDTAKYMREEVHFSNFSSYGINREEKSV